MKKTTLILSMLLLFVFAACADWPQVSIIKLKTSVKNHITISEANENAMATKGKPLYVLELKIDGKDQSSSQEIDYFLADVASFNVTWPQTDLVPDITYSAYVTLTIEVE